MKRIYLSAVTLFTLFLSAADAHAQLSSSKQLMTLFREVIARPKQSTVRVKSYGKDAALGVIVSPDGWILSKYSELKGKKPFVRLPDGSDVEAEMFGFDEPFDLVMLKVDAKDLTPVVWTDSKVSKVGHWAASVGTDSEPVALGVISVAARKVDGAKFVAPTGAPGGFLGLALDLEFSGVKIQEVLPKTPASKAGFEAEDVILALNGEKVQNVEEFQALMSRKKPGDVVTVKISRKDKEIELKATLAERPGNSKDGKSRGEQQNLMGSKLSDRKAGFPVILQHDSILKPTDCGGPLVNLDGKVLGINISRAGRTETYAIPSEIVRPLLERLKTRNGDPKDTKQ